jgi:hypothetical protein
MVGITKLTVGEGWQLVRWFAFAVVAGAIGLSLYPGSWPLYRVIEKVCDALVVAGVIGLVVELSSLNSVVRRVSEEVARKTSAFHLPPAIRDQIWNIMNTKLVRHDYERRYRLSRIPGGKLNIESIITFNVRNHGTSAAEYSPMVAEEEVYNPTFLHVEYSLPNGPTNAPEGTQVHDRYEPTTLPDFMLGLFLLRHSELLSGSLLIFGRLLWIRAQT